MSKIRLKAKCIRCMFKKDSFRIFSWSPIGKYSPLTLSPYYTFSSKGEDTYIDEGKEYELEVEEISSDNKYGSCVKIISVPSLNSIDFSTVTRDESYEILMDCTSSGRIANNILDAYPNFIELILTQGKEAIDVKKIVGVGDAYLNAYARNLIEKYKYYSMLQRFKNYQINITDCKTLSSVYTTEDLIEDAFSENPYKVMIDILNKSFEVSDKIILECRPELKESKERCAYLILSVLKRNELDGSTRLSGEDLYAYITTELQVSELEPLIYDTAINNELFYYDEESGDLSSAQTFDGECYITDFALNKVKDSIKLDIDWKEYMQIDDFIMSEKQGSALEMFCNYNFMILAGVSGGGKTTSLRGLIKLMEHNNLSYTLLAPTGKASMRMTEAVNRPSSTIHRKCLKDKDISTDVIIIDEMSMVDLPTFLMLLHCISNPLARIVLVGDNNQLMPVGVGCIFNDLINSGKIPMVLLDEVFRYKTNGGLFVATNIRQGKSFFDDKEMVKCNNDTYSVCDNYKFIKTDDIFDEVLNQYKGLIKKGIKAKDILCLSPQNVGEIGTYIINNTIQSEINPPKPNENVLTRKISGVEIKFRVGDMVINKKNNYQALPLESYQEILKSDGCLTAEDVETTVIFNGQCGIVREVRENVLIIQFDEELIVFDKHNLDNLLLSYCISVHSSQGSESQYVINIVSDKHKRMLSKNLLYVADTRAKKTTIDIGNITAFNDALLIDGNKERDTWLKELLQNPSKINRK